MVQGKFGDVKTGCEADHVAAIALPARNAHSMSRLTELLQKRRPSIAIRCRLGDSEADEPGDGGGDVSIKSGRSS